MNDEDPVVDHDADSNESSQSEEKSIVESPKNVLVEGKTTFLKSMKDMIHEESILNQTLSEIEVPDVKINITKRDLEIAAKSTEATCNSSCDKLNTKSETNKGKEGLVTVQNYDFLPDADERQHTPQIMSSEVKALTGSKTESTDISLERTVPFRVVNIDDSLNTSDLRDCGKEFGVKINNDKEKIFDCNNEVQKDASETKVSEIQDNPKVPSSTITNPSIIKNPVSMGMVKPITPSTEHTVCNFEVKKQPTARKGQASKPTVTRYSLADFKAGKDPDALPSKGLAVNSGLVPVDVSTATTPSNNSSNENDSLLVLDTCSDTTHSAGNISESDSHVQVLDHQYIPKDPVICIKTKKEIDPDYIADGPITILQPKKDSSHHRNRKIIIPESRDGIYYCQHCEYKNKDRISIRSHYLRYHVEKDNKCDHCEKSFGFLSDLRKHQKIVHGGKVQCEICDKIYRSEVTLKKHMETHAEGYVKSTYPCYKCKKSFASQYYLLNHMKYDHDKVERPKFKCDWCGATFTQKGHMMEHTNMHTGNKPHQCNICGKKFMYSASLRVHKAIHKDERKYECENCPATFKTRQGLMMHSDMHKEHKFKCAYCGKTFWQKGGLIRHTRMHLGLKPYVCTMCGNSFTDPSILRRHLLYKHKVPQESLSEFMEIARIGSKKLSGEYTSQTLENIHSLVLRGEAPKAPPIVSQEQHMVLLVSDTGEQIHIPARSTTESGNTVFEVHLENSVEDLAAALSNTIAATKSTDKSGKEGSETRGYTDEKPNLEELESEAIVTKAGEHEETTTELTVNTPHGETLLVIQGAPHEIDLPKVLQSLDIILQPDAPDSVIVEECEVPGSADMQQVYIQVEKNLDNPDQHKETTEGIHEHQEEQKNNETREKTYISLLNVPEDPENHEQKESPQETQEFYQEEKDDLGKRERTYISLLNVPEDPKNGGQQKETTQAIQEYEEKLKNNVELQNRTLNVPENAESQEQQNNISQVTLEQLEYQQKQKNHDETQNSTCVSAVNVSVYNTNESGSVKANDDLPTMVVDIVSKIQQVEQDTENGKPLLESPPVKQE